MAQLAGICWTNYIEDLGNGWHRGIIDFGKWRCYQFTSQSTADIEAWFKQKQEQEKRRVMRRG